MNRFILSVVGLFLLLSGTLSAEYDSGAASTETPTGKVATLVESSDAYEPTEESEASSASGSGYEKKGKEKIEVPDAPVNLNDFARLSVLHGGRIMPVDSFAQVHLVQFSGRRTYGRKPAVDWLARLMMSDDDEPQNERIFLLNNPDLATSIGLTPRDDRRYTFAEFNAGTNMSQLITLVNTAAEKDSKGEALDLIDKGASSIYRNLMAYLQISGVFTYADPAGDMVVSKATAQKLGYEDTTLSPLMVVGKIGELRDIFMASHQSGAEMPEFEREVFYIMRALQMRNQRINEMTSAERQFPFEILVRNPYPDESVTEHQWMAPWEAVVDLRVPPRIHSQLSTLDDMRQAYRAGDDQAFQAAVGVFKASREAAFEGGFESRHVELEMILNRSNPFFWSQWLYVLGFALVMISLLFPRNARLVWMAFTAAIAGVILTAFVLNGAGIIMRMLVMDRPPITNLYSTFITVSWLCVLVGLLLTRIDLKDEGYILASVSGGVLMFISSKFQGDGDTMGPLVAVLDSNFWLSTHVTTIIIGYAGCCAAGVLGHVYLFVEYFRGDTPEDKKRSRMLYGAIIGVLGFGLIFSVLGTILGGIWADYSWGRFWGWDPKENGALLIVLWTAMLFHMRIGGMIRQRGMAIGAALGIIVVMLAWFGVNLLNTGLHSYGFTEGAATVLFLYVAGQILFCIVMGKLLAYKERQRRAAG